VSEFRSGVARVRVPCSSANLGPVFDYAGLALGLYDELEAEVVGNDLSVAVHGESADRVPVDRRHMVVRVMDDTWTAMGVTPPVGLRLVARNAIPHGRGLGSSAAAIAAGIVLARALVVDGEQRFSDADVFNLGTQLEGHPDNISASLFGGLTLAWVERDASNSDIANHVSLRVDDGVVPVVVIPGDILPTKKARAMLPADVPHKDAAFNAGRSALLVQALTRQPELLLAATADRLHQEQRRSAMPASLDLVDALRAAGIPAVISGAGPCVLAFASELTAPLVADLVGQAHVTRQLPVAYDGALGSVTI
jgi:homoserine kinase